MYFQDEENGSVYINNDRIWLVLRGDFGLNDTEVVELIKDWLGETYNLRGSIPYKRWYGPII